MLNNKTILVTGGTGSFGKKFIEIILNRYPDIKKIIIYSRDELKQFEMAEMPIFKKYDTKLRYFIGDVREPNRLLRAFEDVDVVIHAAALKQVPAAEYNPFECIKTNVLGAQNVIEAAFATSVQKVIALSTDKAAAPVNLYGASKLCSDKLFVAANNMKGKRNISLSVVRYGNVFGSRGSVVPFFLKKRIEGIIPITHPEMTRFSLTLEEGVSMVLRALSNSWGGEVFVPKIPSYRITDMADAIAPSCERVTTGIRPGEKLHEEMITQSDALNCVDCGDYYVILPSTPYWNVDHFYKAFNAKKVPPDFYYNSGHNTSWLTQVEIKKMLKDYMDYSGLAHDVKRESATDLYPTRGQRADYEDIPTV